MRAFRRGLTRVRLYRGQSALDRVSWRVVNAIADREGQIADGVGEFLLFLERMIFDFFSNDINAVEDPSSRTILVFPKDGETPLFHFA